MFGCVILEKYLFLTIHRYTASLETGLIITIGYERSILISTCSSSHTQEDFYAHTEGTRGILFCTWAVQEQQ